MEATCRALAVYVSLDYTKKIHMLEQEVKDLGKVVWRQQKKNTVLATKLQRMNSILMIAPYVAFMDRVDGLFTDLFSDLLSDNPEPIADVQLIHTARLRFLQARTELERMRIAWDEAQMLMAPDEARSSDSESEESGPEILEADEESVDTYGPESEESGPGSGEI